jgi:hypothetical protein
LPSGQSSLTPEWLTQVLRQAAAIDAGRVAEVSVEPVGTGQVADCFRCRLSYDDAEPRAPRSVIAKLPAEDPTSRCLHAEIDTGSGMFALVLDDLAPARETDQLSGLAPDDACTAVLELAGLHAARWGDPRRLGLGWLEDLREHYSAAYAEFIPPLFDAAGGTIPLAVVDWQTIVTGPALVDVAFLLGASLDPADRRAHEHDLVREYHRALSARGVTGYPWDYCWTDYRRYAYHCLAFLVPAAMIVEQTPRGDEMFLTMIRRG